MGNYKNPDNETVAKESMFVATILEKKNNKIKISQESVTVL